MYISRWGEEIIADHTLSNDYLEVVMAGITYPNPVYRIMHNVSKEFPYDYYVFEYVVRGVGHIETPEAEYKVQEGDFYFLNKLRYHIYYADTKDHTKNCLWYSREASWIFWWRVITSVTACTSKNATSKGS